MNQLYDEPMDRVCVSIPRKDHLWVKEYAQRLGLKKGTVLRNLILFGVRTDQKIEADYDRLRQTTAIRDGDCDLEGQPTQLHMPSA